MTGMETWSARLVFAGGYPAAENQRDILCAVVSELDAAIGQDAQGNLDVDMAVEAESIVEAISRAIATCDLAFRKAGIAGATLIEVETMTWQEFERRLAEPIELAVDDD